MRDNIIPAEEGGLVLHRLITEQLPVVAFFVSGDGSVRAIVRGFVNSFTQDKGLAICTPFVRDKPIPAALEFPHDLIVASTYRYSDDTETPKDLEVGSGLRIEMPNGDNLTILEVRSQKA
jgi:hypothetical protein